MNEKYKFKITNRKTRVIKKRMFMFGVRKNRTRNKTRSDKNKIGRRIYSAQGRNV